MSPELSAGLKPVTPPYMAAWHQRTKEERRAKRNAYKRAYYQRHKAQESEKRKNNRLKSLYGITLAEREAMRAAQNNTCPVCKKLLPAVPHVDHCHRTGRVRGLVHKGCNSLLGFARDDIAILQGAIQYLSVNL